MMMVECDGEVFGYFFIDSVIGYELMDLGSHSNILVKYSPLYFELTTPDCAYENPIDDFNEPDEIETRNACTEDAIPIRILVYYSDAASKEIIPEQKVRLFIEQMNMALENSNLEETQIFFEIAAILPTSELPGLTLWEETNNIRNDLEDVQMRFPDNLTNDPRELHGADLVCVIADGNYDNCKTFGFAFQRDFGDNSQGFSIVEGDGGMKYTFAHEVAHNLGCGHHDNELEPENARGAYWGKSTLMVTGGSPAAAKRKRILYYSNPDVSYKSHVTGYEDSRDNARQLLEARDIVADNFCSEPTYVLALIEGNHFVHSIVPVTYKANVLYCSSVTNYHWRISGNGINYIGLGQGSTMDEVTFYMTGIKKAYLKLIVTCSNSEVDTDVFLIHNYNQFNPLVNEDVNSQLSKTFDL